MRFSFLFPNLLGVLLFYRSQWHPIEHRSLGQSRAVFHEKQGAFMNGSFISRKGKKRYTKEKREREITKARYRWSPCFRSEPDNYLATQIGRAHV